jgi:hypothetical protein
MMTLQKEENNMRKTSFLMEAYNNSFEGYTNNSDWNGWACPFFTFDQAEKVSEAHKNNGLKSYYDEPNDAFAFQIAGDDKLEVYPSIEIDGQKYYTIGNSNWIWEEVSESQ